MKTPFGRESFPVILLFTGMMGAVFFFLAQQQGDRPKDKARSTKDEMIQASQNQSLQKFDLTGFDEGGKKFWNLQGDVAKIDPGETVYLEQNVTLKLRDDTIVRTDHVQWSNQKGLLRTQAPVFVEHLSTKVNGIGAVGRLNESFIQLNKDIQMTINPTTTLHCTGPMKVFYKENLMIFYRNVVVTDDKGTLRSNRMDVYFDGTERKVTKIVAIGSVEIDRGDDHSKSQRAIYTPATGAVRLEGNPEITLHKESEALLTSGFKAT